MSKIDELIKEMCPNGVEYKKVGEIADVSIGLATSVTKYKRDSGVLLLHNSDIQQGRIELKNIEYIDDSFAKKNSSKLLRKNDIITVHTGDVGTSAVITDEYAGTIGFTTITSRIRDFNQVYPYYLCTYFNSHKCKMDIRKMTISDRSNLNQKDFIKIKIPIPPLPIQREIVRILDSFTELTEELKNELTKRNKQYEYYRDYLLKPKENIPMVKLGDIGQVRMCKRILKSQTNLNTGVPFYKIGTFGHEADSYISNKLFLEYKNKYPYPKKGDILISCSGTIGRTVAFDGKPAYFQDSNIVWLEHDGTKVSNKYLMYCYNRNPWKTSLGGTISRLYNKDILNSEIPVPSLEVQHRLVKFLDNFDSICSDLKIGLPAEIEARQKQYEHYRNKLLTFNEMKNKMSLQENE